LTEITKFNAHQIFPLYGILTLLAVTRQTTISSRLDLGLKCI